jgi:oxidase EvaA
MNREVSSWDQPIIKQDNPGIVGFIVKEIDGVLHFLTQLKLESGVMDLLEISPTVQCITGNYSYKMLPKFVDEMIHRKNLETITDVFQSEEGGRFFRESNQNIILLAGESSQQDEDQDFIWMTMNQLKQFIKFNNFLNVEARSLLACLPTS